MNGEVVVGAVRVAHSSAGTWDCQPWWFWARVGLVGGDQTGVSFLLKTADAESFVSLANAYRHRHAHHDQIRQAAELLRRWEAMLSAERYLPRHEIEAWAADAVETAEVLASSLLELGKVSRECPSLRLAALLRDPFTVANRRNDLFVAREQVRLDSWFSGFDRPPTKTQREVAIRDETNTLVVAGAGTGKTSAIITKIRYLLHAGIAPPEQIVVLAFNTDAADEIRERCKDCGGEGVTVHTFHALGLRILGDAPGEKPPVLSELTTDESRAALIEKLIVKLAEDKAYAERYAKFIFLYPRPLVDRFGSDSEAQYVSRTKSAITASLSGDWVRSSEELRIANWLFAHGIAFEYEKPYPFDTSGAQRTRYRPDFTLTYLKVAEDGTRTEVTVYLEHQALNQRGEAPSWMKRYSEKVEWARATHRQHATTLVESFSWWFHKGIWEVELRTALTKAGITVPEVDWQARLRAAERSESKRFEADRRNVLSLVRRALDLVRCTADVPTGEGDLSRLIQAQGLSAGRAPVPVVNFDASREVLFDQIFRPIQIAYEAHKKKREGIDFEDMIFRARQVVKSGGFLAPWSHYIVDEYQDASLSRLELVQLLRKQRPDSRLVCVGDDWQAIIRFAGGDIRVMTQFAQRVGVFWQANLGQTFRYSPTIAEISSEFIVANPNQLKKTITPASGSENRPVRIVLSAPVESGGAPEEEQQFNDVLFSELAAIREFKRDASVLLLSRYRRGIPETAEQDSIRRAFPTLTLTWSTVHRSKGREADAVLVADLNDDAFGFPCLREDDPLIRRFLPPEDSFDHAEERRLFYVAMTRARHWLALIGNAVAPSPFIGEVIRQRGGRPGLEIIRSGEAAKPCPRCGVGFVVGRDGTNGRFYACTKSPVCSHKEQACPACRRGFLSPEGSRIVCSGRKTHGCTHTARTCPRCGTGFLVPRLNRQKGTSFWGCSRFSDEEGQCRYTQNN